MDTKGLFKVYFLKQKLANEFLNYKNGDFIETISKYQEKFNASRGSVQIALKELQSERAIILQSKGASGTQIVKLDYDELLKVVNVNTVIGAMPLPYSLIYEGLATGFIKLFKQAPFRFAWSYLRGSLNRVNGLLNDEFDFVILSLMAAEYYKNIYDLNIVTTLDANSYSTENVWVVKKGIKEIKSGMKIGLDKASFDQVYLTNTVIKDLKVEYVDIRFPNVVNKILDGSIDAAIWSVDMIDIFKSDQIDTIPLKNTSKEYEQAAVVIKRNRGDIKKIIKDYIKPSALKEIQNMVIKGEIVPGL